MLSQEPGSYSVSIEGVDPHPLISRLFTGNNSDVSSGDVEHFDEEGDERVIRGAVHRRRRQPDQNRTRTLAIDAGPRGSGYHANIDRSCQRSTANYCRLPTANC
jgi:hypothetical protein